MALAVVLCVGMICAAALIGWRWWLAHQVALTSIRVSDLDANYRAKVDEAAKLHGEFDAIKRRVTQLEASRPPR